MPPVTRVVTSDRMNARDITDEFTEAAASTLFTLNYELLLHILGGN